MHTLDSPTWIYSPFAGVRWSTILTWVVLFVLVTWRTRNPIKGLVVAMTWLSAFEIVYQATGSLVHGWSLMTLTYTTTGTAGWLVAAYLIGIRPEWRTIAVSAGLWLVWIALGYNSNMPDRIIPGADGHWSWTDEALNVGTKTLVALALAVGASGWHAAARDGSVAKSTIGPAEASRG